MKPPRTEAEWDALLDAEERALAATQTEAEYWAVFREQQQVRSAIDDGTSRDAFEVLDEILVEIAERYPDSGGAQRPS